jgi:hypothetical protein
MMTAYEIFKTLSQVGGWAEETPRVRWLAARYYANVESLEQLRKHAEPVIIRDEFRTCPPLLTAAQVRMIIMLR